MWAFEQQPHESNVAFGVYKVYRDLGPTRTMKEAAAIYYNRPEYQKDARSVPSRVKAWSAGHHWVERARQRDEYVDSIKRAAVQEAEQRADVQVAERQAQLREKLLGAADKAADNLIQMLNWPIAEQRIEKIDENGNPVVTVLTPAKWNKNTVKRLYDMASKAAGEPDLLDVTSGGQLLEGSSSSEYPETEEVPELDRRIQQLEREIQQLGG